MFMQRRLFDDEFYDFEGSIRTACNPKSPAGIKGSYSNGMVIMVHAYEFIVAINWYQIDTLAKLKHRNRYIGGNEIIVRVTG